MKIKITDQKNHQDGHWTLEKYERTDEIPPRGMFLNYIRDHRDKGIPELIKGFADTLGIEVPNGEFRGEMSDAHYHFPRD